MKIAIIGGGSTYTPELINGFLARSGALPISELWLMDTDAERLDIVGGFARRIAQANREPFQVRLTTQREEAIHGAAYVITQFRVGKMEARRADEYLGRRHHLIGQETTGIGGMAKALRTIPVMLDIAADMRTLAPEALLVNFTNPAGLVVQALARYAPDILAVGLCNAPYNTRMGMAKLLEARLGEVLLPEQTELKTLGLNHLSWHYGFTLDGEDVWGQVLEASIDSLRSDPDPQWEPELIENLGMIPNYYLEYYYYTERMLALQENWPPSRAEQVMAVESDLLRMYADPELKEPPVELMKRGGAYYSTVATQLINAHYNNLGETHVVNIRHDGAVPAWSPNWVLEMPCRVDWAGIHPLPADALPPVCFGLLAQVKAFEQLVVEAAVNGDPRAAYQALLAHPLGPPADRVQAVLDDLLATHREYLPRFW